MRQLFDIDVVVIGFGSAGMTAAETAADLGLRVCVVERERAGGDCLWTGCVPSKALIASAKAAHVMRTAERFGLAAHDPIVDLAVVWRRCRAVRAEIAGGDDDPQRFIAKGVDVRWGSGRIVGEHAVDITGSDGTVSRVTGRIVLVCTGGRPAVPDIPGLVEAGFVTTETFFDLEEVPQRVVLIGGGPVAVELAQACRRLGIGVVVLEQGPTLLPREERELVASLTEVLVAEGVEVVTDVFVERVEPGLRVIGRSGTAERVWETDAVVVAVGRRVDASGLGLEAVGIAYDGHGVTVDRCGRTSVRSIYAAGDITGHQLFTHAAASQAVVAVRDAFYPGRARAAAVVPWATFTDPPLAHAGMTIAEATSRFGRRGVTVHRWSLDHNDRAHADDGRGAIVLVEHVSRWRRRLVGAHVLASGADELIGELALAIEQGSAVADLGSRVHVYPTIGTSVQQLGGRAALTRAARYRWLMQRGRRG